MRDGVRTIWGMTQEEKEEFNDFRDMAIRYIEDLLPAIGGYEAEEEKIYSEAEKKGINVPKGWVHPKLRKRVSVRLGKSVFSLYPRTSALIGAIERFKTAETKASHYEGRFGPYAYRSSHKPGQSLAYGRWPAQFSKRTWQSTPFVFFRHPDGYVSLCANAENKGNVIDEETNKFPTPTFDIRHVYPVGLWKARKTDGDIKTTAVRVAEKIPTDGWDPVNVIAGREDGENENAYCRDDNGHEVVFDLRQLEVLLTESGAKKRAFEENGKKIKKHDFRLNATRGMLGIFSDGDLTAVLKCAKTFL